MTPPLVLEKIQDVGVLPVIRTPSRELAERAIEAVVEGGLTVLEVTLTTPGAVELIGALAARPSRGLLVGAGSVTSLAQAERSVDAGAQFIVTPGLHVELVRAMKKRGVAVIAGALTPTEVMAADACGADWIKIFPCNALGGSRYLKALRAPLPHLKLVPTGGVNLENASEFIRAGAVALGIGTDLIDVDALARGEDQELVRSTRVLLETVRLARTH